MIDDGVHKSHALESFDCVAGLDDYFSTHVRCSPAAVLRTFRFVAAGLQFSVESLWPSLLAATKAAGGNVALDGWVFRSLPVDDPFLARAVLEMADGRGGYVVDLRLKPELTEEANAALLALHRDPASMIRAVLEPGPGERAIRENGASYLPPRMSTEFDYLTARPFAGVAGIPDGLVIDRVDEESLGRLEDVAEAGPEEGSRIFKFRPNSTGGGVASFGHFSQVEDPLAGLFVLNLLRRATAAIRPHSVAETAVRAKRLASTEIVEVAGAGERLVTTAGAWAACADEGSAGSTLSAMTAGFAARSMAADVSWNAEALSLLSDALLETGHDEESREVEMADGAFAHVDVMPSGRRGLHLREGGLALRIEIGADVKGFPEEIVVEAVPGDPADASPFREPRLLGAFELAGQDGRGRPSYRATGTGGTSTASLSLFAELPSFVDCLIDHLEHEYGIDFEARRVIYGIDFEARRVPG